MRTLFCILLTVAGLSSIIGQATGVRIFQEVGSFLFAPNPRVFCNDEMSVQLQLEIQTADQQQISVPMTHELYTRIHGPLARVNVYSHALMYSRFLEKPLYTQVLRYGICNGGPLAIDLGLPLNITKATFLISFRGTSRHDPYSSSIDCAREGEKIG